MPSWNRRSRVTRTLITKQFMFQNCVHRANRASDVWFNRKTDTLIYRKSDATHSDDQC